MSEATISTVDQLRQTFETAWLAFESFLAGLKPEDASKKDGAGWGVKDHVTHLAIWEESVAIVFRGGKRHEALGIDEPFYQQGSFDEINEVIKKREEHLTIDQSVERLRAVHHELKDELRALSNADLLKTVREFFPTAPRTDDRPVVVFLYDNTAGHIVEHLPWMEALVSGSS
ncbi:MAG TPA: DinB family protein [Anaerolineales bacterium]|nr:DinB family protein [Anaerolineales bacterium]